MRARAAQAGRAEILRQRLLAGAPVDSAARLQEREGAANEENAMASLLDLTVQGDVHPRVERGFASGSAKAGLRRSPRARDPIRTRCTRA